VSLGASVGKRVEEELMAEIRDQDRNRTTQIVVAMLQNAALGNIKFEFADTGEKMGKFLGQVYKETLKAIANAG